MPDEFISLRDLIHERTGLFFANGFGATTLEKLLRPLMEKAGCASATAYYGFLESEPGAGEWLNVIAALSKPVSSFLRAAPQIRTLIDTVIPQLVKTGGNMPLRIWSAGCATGEEPLAIAMALSEAGWFDRAGIEIQASDVNITAIEKARAGFYSEFRLRYLAPELRGKYFVPAGDRWLVCPELHERINWSVANLMDEEEIAELAASPVIFCRNVFIYFSDSTIRQALNLLGKYMPRGGCLFTDGGDHFTSLVDKIGVFEKEKIDGVSIWRRRGS
jgi:chemotaxis protein methyltransferase CheR